MTDHDGYDVNWDTEETMRWIDNTEGLEREVSRWARDGAASAEYVVRGWLEGAEYFDVDYDEVDWQTVYDIYQEDDDDE